VLLPQATLGQRDPPTAATSWDANPNQNFGGTVGILNPFTIGPVTDSTGAASDGNALTIACHKTTAAQASAIAGVNAGVSYSRWGGAIELNGTRQYLTVGCFVEIRALFNGYSPNMWPAIWFYASDGESGPLNTGIYTTAEIDEVEPENGPYPYVTIWPNGNGDRTSPYGWNPYGSQIPANTWMTWGMDWQPTALTFYVNGVEVGVATDNSPGYHSSGAAFSPTNLATYFNNPNCKLGIRIDNKTGGGTDSGPDPMTISIDNIRIWSSFAASRA
jgi:Glycosyl hydrolases family 16